MAELNRVIEALREQILSTEPLDDSTRQSGLALRMILEGWTHLPPEIRQEMESALMGESPAEAISRVFSAHSKAIARASAQGVLYRYPTERAALHAYEAFYQARPDVQADRLERALMASPLVPPESALGVRASTLLETFLRLSPFAGDQAGVALVLTLAFLQAHGADYPSDAEDLTRLVQNPATLQSIEASGNPSTLPYPDLIEAILAESKPQLVAVEAAIRQQALVPLANLPAPARTALQPVPGPSSEWRYLTLQDLIWINTEVTKRPQPYSYERLEEATYYQYSYRQSRDVVLQAARFLWGYLKYRPFAQGNYATALIATLALLQINGYEAHLPVEQANEWLLSVAERKKHPLDAIRQIVHPLQPGKQPIPLREHVHHLIEHYEPALHTLMQHETPLPV
ncbi:hypothetical protein GBSOP10_102424 [Armatimonadetes bacterium GBS]|nr:hypothetical protein GBSOP10_102424 [Armatimonadetes bacterium GBS]